MGWAEGLMALISALGLFKGGGTSADPTAATTDPNIQATLELQRRRMEQSQPLYEAVQRLAMGLMPKSYQQGQSALDPYVHTPPAGTSIPGAPPPGAGPTGLPPSNDRPWATPDSLRLYRPGGRNER